MRSRLQKLATLWPILVALISGASGAYAWTTTQLDKKIQAAVAAHDRELETASHPSHLTRIKAQEDHWVGHVAEHNRIYSRLDKLEKSLKELYLFKVGDKAADTEKDRRKRAQAAWMAKERFRRYIKEGESLPDAYRRTLETTPTW